MFILEETDAKTVQKAGNFLRTFASEPYSDEKYNRAVDAAVLEYYKLDKQVLQNLVIKQRGKGRQHRAL